MPTANLDGSERDRFHPWLSLSARWSVGCPRRSRRSTGCPHSGQRPLVFPRRQYPQSGHDGPKRERGTSRRRRMMAYTPILGPMHNGVPTSHMTSAIFQPLSQSVGGSIHTSASKPHVHAGTNARAWPHPRIRHPTTAVAAVVTTRSVPHHQLSSRGSHDVSRGSSAPAPRPRIQVVRRLHPRCSRGHHTACD